MKIYNTLTRQKQEFVPVEEGKVKMYACGPTVYNLFHIGNARPLIIFDALRNYFEYRGYEVTFVQNFTDVDDKMINRAREENCTVKEIADKYINEYYKDAKGLGVREATVHPKATEHIDDIIALVKKLIDKGHAYEVDGDVYFDTKSFKEYGKLSHQPLEDLENGARVSSDERKHDPMDFALWKKRKLPDEIAWESPWGLGRPGWHIECSAMSCKYLGETFDIHGGGLDLIFPHHENEIAQSEAASGKLLANYWMHNGFINVNNEKMSKSKGNFFTVRDIVKEYSYDVIRFMMLSVHYRSPINFSSEILDASKNALERITICRNNLDFVIKGATSGKIREEVKKNADDYREKFITVLDDDFNTADGISVIFELVKYINTLDNATKEELEILRDTLGEFCKVLNIANTQKEPIDSEIEELIEKRNEARKQKNFKEADAIRDKLKEMHIILEDTPAGVKWRKEQ